MASEPETAKTLEEAISLDLQKTITFKRLPLKHVTGYEVYGEFRDSSYSSGVRYELLGKIDNPSVPNVHEVSIDLPYNQDATWKLPDDAYLDRDHIFYLDLTNEDNSERLDSMYIAFNRITRLITLDTLNKDYNVNSKVRLTYFQDLITKKYSLLGDYNFVKDCKIIVKPIFTDNYLYGTHNIII